MVEKEPQIASEVTINDQTRKTSLIKRLKLSSDVGFYAVFTPILKFAFTENQKSYGDLAGLLPPLLSMTLWDHAKGQFILAGQEINPSRKRNRIINGLLDEVGGASMIATSFIGQLSDQNPLTWAVYGIIAGGATYLLTKTIDSKIYNLISKQVL
jgi:hypothetical protein